MADVKEKINLLDVIPFRSENITAEKGSDGTVTIAFPRFKYEWMRRFLLPKGMSADIHVRLEDHGTAVWELIDGKRTVRRIIEELAECDFGEFENKNYKELEGNSHYQEWIDSNGTLPFPGGESREGFKSRNLRGFDRVVSGCIRSHVAEAALVIHGGTIMNIMEEYADIQKPFYEWHVRNGGGYEVELDENLWKNGRKQLRVNSAIMEG